MPALDHENSDHNEATIRAGFDGVMDGVDLGGRDREQIFRAFQDAIRSWERDGGQRAIDLYVGPHGWCWSWLEQGAHELHRMGV